MVVAVAVEVLPVVTLVAIDGDPFICGQLAAKWPIPQRIHCVEGDNHGAATVTVAVAGTDGTGTGAATCGGGA